MTTPAALEAVAGECKFPECTRPIHGNGLCKTHRQQEVRGRGLTKIAPRHGSLSIAERFWSKVQREEGCWEWTGAIRPQGYGAFHIGLRLEYPHRIAWGLANGREIPEGMVIDHICFNGRCVNPDHLRLATRTLNAEYQHRGKRKVPESGYRGVYRNRGKWAARVKHAGVVHNLGSFESAEDANAAAAAKRRELFKFPEYQGGTK